jgi:predicted DNA-binding transcriptional regulator YafY
MEALLRIEKIIALLETNPQGLRGEELARSCNVPWPVMEKDLATILEATENPIPLYSEADGLEACQIITPRTRWYLDTTCKRNSPVHLTIGETLQIINSLDFIHPKSKTTSAKSYSAKSTNAESYSSKNTGSLREKLAAALDLKEQGSFRYVKGGMAPLEPMEEDCLLTVEQAINHLKKISFYSHAEKIVGAPLGIIYYSRLRRWYLAVMVENTIKTYSFTRVQNIREEPESFTYPSDFSLEEWLAPQWGMEFGEPLKVKVSFSNRAQTMAKVRKDTAHRKCRLTEEEGGQTLLYEDTGIGKNEFIAWILGFGSAAEVLEPYELRQELGARIKETLARYR